MDKKKIYGKWSITDEIVGYPLMIHAWIKGKKVSQLLEKRIEIAKNKADEIEINLSKVDEYRIEYEELDNFFAHYFRKIDSSEHKSFEEKINYCLSQFKREANTLYSSSKLMILQSNFLNGAEKTLKLYYIIDRCNKEEKQLHDKSLKNNRESFEKIFSKSSYGSTFLNLLENSFLDGNNQLIIEKGILSGYLNHLRNRKIIKDISDKEIRKQLEAVGIIIPRSTYSNGKNQPLNPKDIEWLNEKFPI